MALTPGGLPYPAGTDFVVNGDDAMHALATALDVRVPVIGGAGAMLGPNYGGTTPNITAAQIKVQTLNGVTDANGVQRCTWKTAFPNAIMWVGCSTLAGSAVAPTFIFPVGLAYVDVKFAGAANTSVTAMIVAIGY